MQVIEKQGLAQVTAVVRVVKAIDTCKLAKSEVRA